MLRNRLQQSGPNAISLMACLLRVLSDCWQDRWPDLSPLTLLDITVIWGCDLALRNRDCRKELARFYQYCAGQGYAGADAGIAARIGSWNCKKNRKLYRNLLSWHPEFGAMTASEFETVRIEVSSRPQDESWNGSYIRILLWICTETLKRPGQILEMESDALSKVENHDGSVSYFLTVPKSKRQLGRASEKWPITNALAADISKFSENLDVKGAQRQCNRLLVSVRASPDKPGYSLQLSINRWVRSRKIFSHRTGELMHLTPTRIRHSGATALALRGMPVPQIQYILEHDSPDSCYVYIDAIGSELCPLIEKVDRKLGGIFTGLLESYFLGHVEDGGGIPILIPLVEMPAVVGGCSSKITCTKHPFFSCYNGCRHFIAWRKADHSRALDYIQAELDRWRSAEGLYDRSKSINDFERVYAAIVAVINRIKSGAK